MNSDLVELIQLLDLQQHTPAFDEAGMDDLGDLVELTGDLLEAWGLDDNEAIRLLSVARQDDPLDYARFTAAARGADAADAEGSAAAAEEAATLAAWLASVKLSDYEEVLFAAGVRVATVAELTEERLRELGIVKSMHRKRLMREAAALAAPVEAEPGFARALSSHAIATEQPKDDVKDVLPMMGLTLAAMRKVAADGRVREDMMTEQLCHEVLMQDTTPPGWTLSSTKTPEGWTNHSYAEAATGQIIHREPGVDPPPGTMTYCNLLSSRGEGALVGTANRFVSHAWMLKFLDVFEALTAGWPSVARQSREDRRADVRQRAGAERRACNRRALQQR